MAQKQNGPVSNIGIFGINHWLNNEEAKKRIDEHGPWMVFDIIDGPDAKDFAVNYFGLSDNEIPKPYLKARMVLPYKKKYVNETIRYGGEFKFEVQSFFQCTPKTETGINLWVKVYYKKHPGLRWEEFAFPDQPDYIKQVKIFGTYNLYKRTGMCGVEFK